MPQDPSKRLVTESDFFDPASPAGARIREAVADDLADPTSPASALLYATTVGGIFTDFTNKPDGNLGTLDSGETWLGQAQGTAQGRIRDGRMTLAAGSVGANYPNLTLDGIPSEVGGVISFGAGSTSTCNATLILTTDPGGLSDLAVHFVSGPSTWVAHYRLDGGTFEVLASGAYPTLGVGEQAHVGVGVQGSTVVIQTADGTLHTITDARISAMLAAGTVSAIWETLTSANTDRLPGWHSVYSASAAEGDGRLRGLLGSAAAAVEQIKSGKRLTARPGQNDQVSIGSGYNTHDGFAAVTLGSGAGQIDLWYNHTNGFFYLPNIAVLIAPGGKLYLNPNNLAVNIILGPNGTIEVGGNGLRFPVYTTTARNALPLNAFNTGVTVYDSTLHKLVTYDFNGGAPGWRDGAGAVV